VVAEVVVEVGEEDVSEGPMVLKSEWVRRYFG